MAQYKVLILLMDLFVDLSLVNVIKTMLNQV